MKRKVEIVIMKIVDKIKLRYRIWKRKRTLKKRLELEMIDTMCTLRKYLYCDSRDHANGRVVGTHLNDHFNNLKSLSLELQGKDIEKDYFEFRNIKDLPFY